jgi:hypothetical protein
VDFCCAEQGLVIELDGGQHVLHAQADAHRTAYLTQVGYRVRRYWDHEVLTQSDVVLEDILRALQESHPHPPLSLKGEGQEKTGRGRQSAGPIPSPAREREKEISGTRTEGKTGASNGTLAPLARGLR